MISIISVREYFLLGTVPFIRRFQLVEPIKLFRVTDRYETTLVVAIQMFEILEILEETLLDIEKSAESGVLIGICKRLFFIILIA